MFERTGLYLHEACRDAAIRVISIESVDDEHYHLLVSWWDVGSCHDPRSMGWLFETVKIKKTDAHKWKKIDNNYRCPAQQPTVFKVPS